MVDITVRGGGVTVCSGVISWVKKDGTKTGKVLRSGPFSSAARQLVPGSRRLHLRTVKFYVKAVGGALEIWVRAVFCFSGLGVRRDGTGRSLPVCFTKMFL